VYLLVNVSNVSTVPTSANIRFVLGFRLKHLQYLNEITLSTMII